MTPPTLSGASVFGISTGAAGYRSQVALLTRIVLALILGVAGFEIGRTDRFAEVNQGFVEQTLGTALLVTAGIIVGLVSGGLVAKLLERANTRLQTSLRRRSGGELLVGSIGMVVGLVIAILASYALRSLEPFGPYLMLPLSLFLAYVFAELAAYKHADILRAVGVRGSDHASQAAKLVDTSALIDGRIKDVVESGFLEGELVIPLFVLEELQVVADSENDLRRRRGRRGLDLVRELDGIALVRTPDADVSNARDVDGKLIRYAIAEDLVLLTTDYNLAKVARLQGVRVLNVNELAGALRPAFLTGENIELRIVRQGKEPGQGVGYLEDGTMIIVEKAADCVGSDVRARVSQVLQTSSGKLVFAELMTGPRRAEPSS